MIVIDGNTTELRIENFSNLEELLVEASGDARLDNRIVTDIFLNDALFSELYPHQAEDISSEEISSVEIRSVPLGEMAFNISTELVKVCHIISEGGRRAGQLFRETNSEEGLELLQDILDVIRDFMSMVNVLRSEFARTDDKVFCSNVEQISSLLAEMTEGLESEDWVVLADLLEFELLPVCDSWKQIIHDLREQLQANGVAGE